MSKKIAIVLFAQAPLLEQAGITFRPYLSAKECLSLYTTYIEDSCQYLNSNTSDFWLTCEESYQETLLWQNFPTIHGCKVASGDFNSKIRDLTDYFLNYQGYSNVTFLFNAFTFLSTKTLTTIDQAFRITSRSIVLLTDTVSSTLGALSISFPFSHLYEDIVWDKPQLAKQIKQHCKDYDIPCKTYKIENLVLTKPEIANQWQIVLSEQYPRLEKQLARLANT